MNLNRFIFSEVCSFLWKNIKIVNTPINNFDHIKLLNLIRFISIIFPKLSCFYISNCSLATSKWRFQLTESKAIRDEFEEVPMNISEKMNNWRKWCISVADFLVEHTLMQFWTTLWESVQFLALELKGSFRIIPTCLG